MYEAINTNQIYKNIKEESNTQENFLEKKLKEGTEKLKNTLKMMKSDMEKISKRPLLQDLERPSTEKATPLRNLNSKNDQINNQNNNQNNKTHPTQNFIRSPSNNQRNDENDSALSSFYNHNLTNNAFINKNKEIKEKLDTGSSKTDTETVLNSKEIFFNRDYKESYEISNNNYNKYNYNLNVMKNSQQINNIKDSKETSAHITASIDYPNAKKSDGFKFSGQNFNSKGSLSLTESKKDIDSDNEYSNYNLDKKILEQRNLNNDEEEENEYRYRLTNPNNQNNLNNQTNSRNEEDLNKNKNLDINEFSKSGTFKSQSNADYSGTGIDYNSNRILNENNTNYTQYSATGFDNYTKYNLNESNTNNNSGNNFYNKRTNNLAVTQNEDEKIKMYSNSNYSNYANVNKNPQREIQEYLNDLENKNLLKIKVEGKNKWVLDFGENNNNNSQSGLNSNSLTLKNTHNYQNDENYKSTNTRNKNNLNYQPATGNTFNKTNTIATKNNSFHNSNKNSSNSKNKDINEERKKYIELKNQIDILKKEKNSLEKFIKETSSNNFYQNNNKSQYDSYKNTHSPTHIISFHNKTLDKREREKDNTYRNSISSKKSNLNTNNISSNAQYGHNTQNTQNMRDSHIIKKFDDLKEYEEEVLGEMKKEDLFDELGYNYQKEDVLGDFIDRVIDGSLYVYKNRNCHTCSRLLSRGESTNNCPKNHH